MRRASILTVLIAAGLAWGGVPARAQAAAAPEAVAAAATAPDDGVILELRDAFRRGDKARLQALLPAARGHALEPWAAYWTLKARLEDASEAEVQGFLARWSGTYQEDRLRNDWLLLAGKRRDWAAFAAEYPRFRMRDDPELRCYDAARRVQQGEPLDAAAVDAVRRDWLAERREGDGCLLAAEVLHQGGQLPAVDLWLKARLALEAGRTGLARSAAALVGPEAAAGVAQIGNSAQRYLARGASADTRTGRELVVLALVRLAVQDPDQAATQLQGPWRERLAPEQRNWAWGVIGKQAALKLQDNASDYFARVERPAELSDDLLGWAVRAALRQGQWQRVAASIQAMGESARQQPVWSYWLARAERALAPDDAARARADQRFERIAADDGFYGKLALEALGRPLAAPPAPAPLTPEERQAARQHPGLQRALRAIELGLRSEGVREWNYWTNLHEAGGMDDRALYAAADLACQHEVWDRCINTSERIQGFSDMAQRFPMPHESAVVRQARATGIDPAYVYGLIRQESRFVTSARSHVGASGLMQIMPATARWTARKIGLEGFTPSKINELDTNVLIGTSYLKLALDRFEDSLPLAAAAYNAGPGRPRAWREGRELEGAIWVENIPFGETRDYVKKVLSNTVDYALLLPGESASLQARLGRVGPAPAGAEETLATRDMP
ncbi:MAG TPA: transglycosylase SLT domain-containing protein [Ottowia sp.]|uniref:lytic transglycosylase domain-containing protein n=1 Tax=Ottowia sp. TaxID=1898956 RepID=UPI002B6B4599|nr:transglycosylase SLT domain-containing protein [Ottowia sp.]HMN20900.1 transglycosylase SLT domain-containing protein [Ottowia sp.]